MLPDRPSLPRWLAFILVVAVAHAVLAVDPPGIINHQGRISVSSVNFEGTGYFKFALVNGAGDVSHWSNDGSSIAGAAPASAIATPVAAGHYSVPLGDTTYHASMSSAIPKEVFAAHDDVRLAIWFSTDNVSFQKLSPNRRLASAAYALSAGSAGTAAAGSVGGEQIAEGAVTSAHIALGGITGDRLADGSVGSAAIGADAVTTHALADGSVVGSKLADGSVSSEKLAPGSVGGDALAAGGVSSSALADGSVTGPKLAPGAVGSANLAGGSVNTAALADRAVTGAKIALGSLSLAHLSDQVGLWEGGDGNVFRATGKVGIGTNAPVGIFEIQGEASVGAETLDQEVLTQPTTSEVAWQSFTAGLTGRLTSLELKVRSPLASSAAPGTIRVYAGEGVGGSVLATQSVTFQLVPASTYQSFSIGVPPQVAAGEVYTIGIETVASEVNWMYVDTTNSYAGGRSEVAAWDLGFRTRVTPVNSTTVLTVRDGNLGLGEAQPTARLHVAGGAVFSGGNGANQTVSWAPGEGSWSFTSDRNTKEGIREVDPEDVLEKVSRIPIAEWRYIGHPERHIGPMAQDFHAAFPLNDRDTSLNHADLHGVSLAAIQGLKRKVEDGESRFAAEQRALREENDSLKARLERLERLLGRHPEGALGE